MSKSFFVITTLKIIKRLSRKKGDFFYRLFFTGMKKFYPEEKQFEAFDTVLWPGGFNHSGEVMDPLNTGADGGQNVTYHEIYRAGVKPHVQSDSVVLEIGPGRGNWTKGMLEAKEVWVLEAKSLEKNEILEYLGSPENLNYLHVRDYKCSELPDNHFDFLFSYGVFVHLPWDGIVEYMTNVYPKLKDGATGLISISDDIKSPSNINYGDWYPGCFTPNNAERMSNLLTDLGYSVLESDFLNCQRDSLVLFNK